MKDFEDASALAGQYQQDDKQSAFTKMPNNVSGEFDTDLDEYVTCAPVFRKLRDLINLWLRDVLKNDQYADNLISHMFRWLTSPAESKLYDPLLHRLVHKLMKKNFFLLVYKLKQLGCKIIYASFHKIIIHTERTTYDEAENFINFVLHTVKQNPMFAFLQLQPSEYWSILLFKDIFNYGGIKESGGTSSRKVTAKWDIALHLPQAV